MSKRINKPVQSILIYERGGRTLDSKFGTPGCVEIIGAYEVGATSAKAAVEMMTSEFSNSRRFFVPNEQIKIEAQDSHNSHSFSPTIKKLARTRSRQRRTSLPHGESQLHRGEIKELFHNDYIKHEENV